MVRTCLVYTLLFLTITLCALEEENITFNLSPDTVFLQELGKVNITITEPPEDLKITFPSVEGIQWGKAESSLHYKVLNQEGEQVRRKKKVYTQPFLTLSEGTFHISGVHIEGATEEYTLPDFTITAQKPEQKAGFIEVNLSTKTPYVGEQIALQYQIFLADRALKYALYLPILGRDKQLRYIPDRQFLADAEYTVELYDIVTSHAVKAKFERKEVNNHTYQVYTIPLLITPRTTDEKIIPEVSGGFKLSFPDEKKRPFHFYHEAKNITPRPLPEPPDNYRDTAVGQYSLHVEIDKKEAYPGDPITLDYIIQGKGDLPLISSPSLEKHPALDNFIVEKDHLSTYYTEDSVRYRYILRATDTESDYLPPFSLTFFDPEVEKYVETETAPIPLDIVPLDILEKPLPSAEDEPIPSTPLSFYRGEALYEKDPFPSFVDSSALYFFLLVLPHKKASFLSFSFKVFSFKRTKKDSYPTPVVISSGN